MNFAFHEDSGVKDGDFILERKAFNLITWEFISTSPVKLLIIKKSTLEWKNQTLSEISSKWGVNYEVYWEQFLENHYISKGKYRDSGKFNSSYSTLYHIEFFTSGTIEYHIKCDPFSIDLILLFITLLGIITAIGILSYIVKISKLITMKINIDKFNSIISPFQENENCNIKFKCEKCGVDIDSDSVFCHKCGFRLKKYK
ncbi:MAG: zinc-ribbon domain-containing protein [Promethearchaeota archaeon]